MSFVLGKDCKLYRNDGSYGSPSLNEVPNVKDLDLSMETAEADVTTRGNNGWEAVVAALSRGEVTFDMVYDTADADFTALQTQFLNKTSVEYFILDGSSATSGKQGLRATFMVTKFDIAQPLTEAVKVAVAMKPTYATNAPSWYTVP